MDELFLVFRRDNTNGIVQTVGEFLSPSPNAAALEAAQVHHMRDWWDYWAVPSQWYREQALDGLLSCSLQ